MLGRGTRVISAPDFQAVTTTPNAHKTRFVIVDAVGVTEQELVDVGTVERKRSAPLKALLDAVAVGAVDDDVLTSLARRLSLLARRLSPAQRQEAARLLGLAAEQGNATAQVNLGTMFEEGRGVKRSLSQAYFWYSLAAAQGLEDTVSLRDAAAQKLKPA